MNSWKSNALLPEDGLGAKLRYMGYYASLLHPRKKILAKYYYQSGNVLGP